MLSAEENALLTVTRAATPMGSLMRQYWLPALLTEEVPTPDCPPVQVRLLGERLVAFRDSTGSVGLIEEACAHRGTSLFYGRNEECGLRCIYHGWKYDRHGNVLDTPAEPTDSTFKDRLKHTAYPTREIGGIVFAYLGPASPPPLFPDYEWVSVPVAQTYVTKCLLECNWLQGLEGETDNAHLEYLHRVASPGTTIQQMEPSNPTWEIEETDFGLRYVALRPGKDDLVFCEVKAFVMPSSAFLGVGLAHRHEGFEVHTYVPADDHSTWRYDFGFQRSAPVQQIHRLSQIGPGYRRLRTLANHYLQDREQQRFADYTGIEDFLNEDACATETMGPIADRTVEHLGASDRAVIALRQYLLRAVASFRESGTAPHIVTDPARNHYRHADAPEEWIPRGDWRRHLPHLVREAPAEDMSIRVL